MKKLRFSSSSINLYHYRNLLDAEGIKTEIRNEHIGSLFAQTPFAAPELWVVNDLDYDRAQKLIDGDPSEDSPSEPWRCSKCGEMNEGQFAACWNCGNAL